MAADNTAYDLGIDLGTTYVAAGILEQGRPEIITLGDRAPVLPSVLFFREDGEVLTGESATRRGLGDPTRVVREFKRRVGDTTPIVVGQTPYSVDVLMAKLLRFVHDAVVERQGLPPRSIAITHPANWGPYKIDVLEQAVRIADIGEVTMITEPVAAAIHYSAAERLEPGETVAVYDLGGGTFDAAVLRKTADDFTVLGEVEGIERLGGIDFDEAVFQHVVRFCGESLGELDLDDTAAIQALARLRQECIEAKEVLSTDTDVTIPVALPNLQSEVRLTRAEFEAMIRPLLQQTVEALRRAVRSAGVEPDELAAVLLVGGSSRIPLIAEMVGAELGRPIAVDRHPKHTVALGAAIAAGRDETETPQVDDWFRSEPTPSVPAQDRGPRAATAAGASAAAVAGAAAAAGVAAGAGAADDPFAMFPLKGEPQGAESRPAAATTGTTSTGTALPTAAATVERSPAPASAEALPPARPEATPTGAPPSPAEKIGTAPIRFEAQAPPVTAAAPVLHQAPAPLRPEPSTSPLDRGRATAGPTFRDHQHLLTPGRSGPSGRIVAMAALAITAVLVLGGTALAFVRNGSEPAGETATDQTEDGTGEGPGSEEGNAAAGGDLGQLDGGDVEPGGPSTMLDRADTAGPSTTVAGPTTTVRPPTSTTAARTTTTKGPIHIRIESGPRVNTRNDTSFQFNYTTNDVCGTGSFTVVEKSTGRNVGSFQGKDVCFGPLHGGFPNGSATFAGFDLKPGTTYRVTVTVRGTASDGHRPAGKGTDSATFEVTTTGSRTGTTTTTTGTTTTTTTGTTTTTDGGPTTTAGSTSTTEAAAAAEETETAATDPAADEGA